METIPWFAWIVIIAIIAGAITALGQALIGKKSELSQALKQNAETNERVLARLDDIDGRLSSVEKTLNELPE